MYLSSSNISFSIDNIVNPLNFSYDIVEPGYCNFFKAVTTWKFKFAQIKINLIHGLINYCYYNWVDMIYIKLLIGIIIYNNWYQIVFEIYNLYFSIFQNNYVVLLMDFSSINFDFSIFKKWVNKLVS